MLKPRPIKGPFGHHDLIYRNRDGTVPRSIKPLKFMSSDGARTLLRQLHVSHIYWPQLVQDLGEMAPLRGQQPRLLTGNLQQPGQWASAPL